MKILSMSGFVPEQICDTVRFTGFDGGERLSHYCGYAADFISQVREDGSIDGAVFPKSCDSSRSIGSYIDDTGKFIYSMPVPAVRNAESVSYFADILKDYKSKIEKHYGVTISEDDVKARDAVITARNAKIAAAYGKLNVLSYASYIHEVHASLNAPYEFDESRIVNGNDGKPVFLIGSFLAGVELADCIENAGLKVVADNMPESGRLASRAGFVSSETDVYKKIASEILCTRPSPTQDLFDETIKSNLEEIRNKGCKGVIFATQKYCEPYDYLFSVYKKALDEQGIPALRVQMADSTDGNGKAAALEAFADII
ncbi:MAG: 2-hydroxyacyl-CoA dehydratase [Clostridiales bacterium]|nr:2-hydroxyacyl-CoA dehydratase [Clostridiales bacterium]